MDSLELFDDLDLGRSPPGDGSCAKPIGRRDAGRQRRPRGVHSRRSSTAVQLIELRGLLERQHAELMGEVHRLRQQRVRELAGGITADQRNRKTPPPDGNPAGAEAVATASHGSMTCPRATSFRCLCLAAAVPHVGTIFAVPLQRSERLPAAAGP
jgi:hypothetical protein